MESGLDGRNNDSRHPGGGEGFGAVSMESGLDGRNNEFLSLLCPIRLNQSQWSPA